MTELQQQETALLKQFVELCNTLQLRYYLVCGSALGAVKYKGFIPWDDDVDVGMPRRDYETFLDKAPALLPDHLFLQNYRTDPAFPHVFSKLRNSRTTLIEADMAHLKMNHGIYIDIFPLDGYPKDRRSITALRYKKKVLNWMHYCALNNDGGWKVSLRNRLFRLFGFHKHTDRTLRRLDALIARYDTEQSDIWCNHGNWQGEREYADRRQYGDGTVAEFEGLSVMVPEQYDAYLTQKYGDWRSDPPADKQRSHHVVAVLDTNKAYTEYIGE